MQASADAAALAGAQDLPNATAAVASAQQYSGDAAGKNAAANIAGVSATVSTRCVTIAPWNPSNAIVVDETTSVPTKFARVLGIDSFTVHPSIDRVGFAVLPPAPSLANKCSTPSSTAYNSTSSPYVLGPLSTDYKVNGTLNTGSALVSTINCVRCGSSTSYATALEKAKAELDANGRPGVQDIIIFLSDGAANTGPTYYPSTSPYRTQPCHQAGRSPATSPAPA